MTTVLDVLAVLILAAAVVVAARIATGELLFRRARRAGKDPATLGILKPTPGRILVYLVVPGLVTASASVLTKDPRSLGAELGAVLALGLDQHMTIRFGIFKLPNQTTTIALMTISTAGGVAGYLLSALL